MDELLEEWREIILVPLRFSYSMMYHLIFSHHCWEKCWGLQACSNSQPIVPNSRVLSVPIEKGTANISAKRFTNVLLCSLSLGEILQSWLRLHAWQRTWLSSLVPKIMIFPVSMDAALQWTYWSRNDEHRIQQIWIVCRNTWVNNWTVFTFSLLMILFCQQAAQEWKVFSHLTDE